MCCKRTTQSVAPWTTDDYSSYSSVTDMLQTLGWRTLQQRRVDARLCLLYKIIHELVAIYMPHFFSTSQYSIKCIYVGLSKGVKDRTRISKPMKDQGLIGTLFYIRGFYLYVCLTKPRERLALVAILSMWLFQDRLLEMSTPNSEHSQLSVGSVRGAHTLWA